MTFRHFRGPSGALGLIVTLATSSLAQQSAPLPPVRHLGRQVAISRDTLGSITGIHALSDGHVLVNDFTTRRLVMYDSTLQHPVVVADSTPSTQKAYGTPVGGIIAFSGDSTLFVDPTSISLLVLDPNGKSVRVIAPPRPADIASLLSITGSGVAYDGRGHLLYHPALPKMTGNLPGLAQAAPPGASTPTPGDMPGHDSAAIIRADIATRAIDTIGFLAMSITQPMHIDRADDGSMTMSMVLYPVRRTDEWAVVSDGSIAMVRASDYHVDWITPAGVHSSSPKMPHDWERLSDSAKQRIVDSTHHAADSIQKVVEKAVATQMGRAGAPPGMTMKVVINTPDITDVPDYLPPFAAGSVVADLENNLWIREGSMAPGPSVAQLYDVVNRKGQLIDRVELPIGLNLMGFGAGVVYLSSREGTGVLLVKQRLR